MRNKSWIMCSVLVIVFLLQASCDSNSVAPQSDSQFSSIISRAEIPVGGVCPNGGVQINSGIDENGNGVLDEDEIDSTETVCNGIDSLISLSDEPPGEQCQNGGTRINSGLDINGNGTLDDSEVTDTEFICNGTLLAYFTIEAGDVCPAGGVQIDSGVDDNGDGVLDTDEVDKTDTICNTAGSLVSVTKEPIGDNCQFGGTRLATGIDSNGDGVLDPEEESNVEFICLGSAAVTGLNSLVFRADKNITNMLELYQTTSDGSGLRKLAGPDISSGSVESFKISPDRTHVAFIMRSYNLSPPELYVADLLSSTPARKVSVPLQLNIDRVGSYSWSPDGNRLVYLVYTIIPDDVGHAKMYTVFRDGTGGHLFDQPVGDRFIRTSIPEWSPDGKYVAFSATRFSNADLILGKSDLYTAQLDGSIQMVSSDAIEEGISLFSWAPDSSRLAYRGITVTFPFLNKLLSVKPDGNENVIISDNNPHFNFRWSANSTWISFLRATDLVLFTVMYDGSIESQISETQAFENAWSPDGSHLAYTSRGCIGVPNPIQKDQLCVANADGTNQVNVMQDPDSLRVKKFSWSADSARLLYLGQGSSPASTSLNVVNQDGSNLAHIIGSQESRSIDSFAWSHNNEYISYSARDTSGGAATLQLYIINSDGTGDIHVSDIPDTVIANRYYNQQWAVDDSYLGYSLHDLFNFDRYLLFTVKPDGSSNQNVSGEMIEGGGVRDFAWEGNPAAIPFDTS